MTTMTTRGEFFVFIFLAWFDVTPTVAIMSGVNEYNFKIFKDKTLPGSAFSNSISEHTVRSSTMCIALCGSKPACVSIYITNETNELYCTLMSEHVDQGQLTSGSGTYAYLDTVKTTGTPLSFSSISYLYTTRYQSRIVAVYDFSASCSKCKTLGVLYDHDADQWPTLSSDCKATLHERIGLSSTVIKIVEVVPNHFYRLEAQCGSDENHYGDDTCDAGGDWSNEGSFTSVSCVSSSCYRLDDSGTAQYSGTNVKTRYGTGCTYWSNTFRSSSDFPLDDYDISKANRYCRDPNSRGRPWCYILPFYDYCSVPVCDWSPFD